MKVANWMTHIDFDWHSRSGATGWWSCRGVEAHPLRRLAAACPTGRCWTTFDAWVRDLETVVEAAGLDRFPILGISQGAAVAVVYAARHPERVTRLVLYGAYPQGRATRHQRGRTTANQLQIDLARLGWGNDDPAFAAGLHRAVHARDRASSGRSSTSQRQTTSAENAAQSAPGVRVHRRGGRRPQVQAPTLVLHARNDRRPPFEQGRMMADLIPNSRFVPLEAATTCCSRTSHLASLPVRGRGLPRGVTCPCGDVPPSRRGTPVTASTWHPSVVDGVSGRCRRYASWSTTRTQGLTLPVHDLRLVLAHAVR